MVMYLAIIGAGYFARKAWKERDASHLIGVLMCVIVGVACQMIGAEMLANPLRR